MLIQTSLKKRSLLQRAPSLIADGFLFVGGATMALSLVWALLCFISPNSNFDTIITWNVNTTTTTTTTTADHGGGLEDLGFDPPERTFYDDPSVSYAVGQPIQNWDEKRGDWLRFHPSFGENTNKIVMVTGSQPSACKNTVGDHLQLRLFKNKVDYCRIHGCDVFYNNVLLDPKGTGFWAKYPVLKAAMVAHPEAEWIWWVDSDAIFTDMDFRVPLEKYKDYNLVVHGWWHMVEKQSWTSVNAGLFLIRNCQWSLDFIEEWASMGPQGPAQEKWGETQKELLKDKLYPGSDDQSALIYLLLKQKEKWAGKVYLETEYQFQSYWLSVVGGLDNITRGYMEVDRELGKLRRRHAEKVSEFYGGIREQYMKDKGIWREFVRRPFVTHFTGCEPCSGEFNPDYTWEACWDGMQKALNFADNQVLKRYGFVHPDLLNNALVDPLPFDFPAA